MYAIIVLPKPPIKQIEDFRKKYDPKCDFIPSHITLVFPFKFTDEDLLIQHIEEKVATLRSFEVVTTGYKKSHDNYLYLVFKRGDVELTNLHDVLYTGILKPHLRSDIEFEPHLTIGYFQNENREFQHENYSKATKELEDIPISWEGTVDGITLVKIEDQLNAVRFVKTISFPSM